MRKCLRCGIESPYITDINKLCSVCIINFLEITNESYITKEGDNIHFVEFSKGKRWAIIPNDKPWDGNIFDSEKEARTYLGGLL